MTWARSPNKVVSGYDPSPQRARYTWHLAANNGRARCNGSFRISEVTAEEVPAGDRTCSICFVRATNPDKRSP